MINLDLQDASRKRTGSSQRSRDWDGTIVETMNEEITLLVSQKKWKTRKVSLTRFREELENRGCLDHKQLKRDKVFNISFKDV